MAGTHDDWLNLVEEAPREADRPLLDAHHHLWDHPGNRYLHGELCADAAKHNVRQTVFVECLSEYRQQGSESLRPVGETEFVEAQANSAAVQTDGVQTATGIVGFADLTLGADVSAVLAAHCAASPARFRGIRHVAAWDASDAIRASHTHPPPHLFARDDFRAGFAELEKHGLLFESWCYHTQLHEVADLARAFPRTTIVVDHVGGPLGIGPYAGRREAVFEHWQAGIRDIAACPNAVVKLGGLAMAINGFGWHKRDLPPGSRELEQAFAPWMHYCIEQFGVERCLFESNFPVDRVSCSYTVLWNAFKRLAAGYSQAQQDALLHDNALAVYGLRSH